MKDEKIMYVDFKDENNDDTCIVKYNDKKEIKPKSLIMNVIKDNKLKKVISIKSESQFIYDRLRYGGYITGLDVFKYTILCEGGGKIIIRNVCETDLYYEELEALAAYKSKIVLKHDEIYPEFSKESDFVYDNPDSKKRR